MAEEPLDPILLQVTIPLPVGMVYEAWIRPDRLAEWLCDRAEVEPRPGGRYHLVWAGPELAFENPGTIRSLRSEVDLDFSWQLPPPFAGLAGGPEPSHVYVRLQESPEGIDVTLEHAGWGAGDAWEEARSWHFHFWSGRLQRLKDRLIAAAYG